MADSILPSLFTFEDHMASCDIIANEMPSFSHMTRSFENVHKEGKIEVDLKYEVLSNIYHPHLKDGGR